MKKYMLIVVLFSLALTLWAAPKFGNVASLKTADLLPDPMDTSGGRVFRPTLRQYQAEGWRVVSVVDVPPETNLIAISYTPIDLDGTNCHLLVKDTYDWVAWQAAARSNEVAYNKSSITNFTLTPKELYKAILQIRNANIPTQYQISAEAAIAIVSNIVSQRP